MRIFETNQILPEPWHRDFGTIIDLLNRFILCFKNDQEIHKWRGYDNQIVRIANFIQKIHTDSSLWRAEIKINTSSDIISFACIFRTQLMHIMHEYMNHILHYFSSCLNCSHAVKHTCHYSTLFLQTFPCHIVLIHIPYFCSFQGNNLKIAVQVLLL